ncbi:capsular polysaccharide synthesis protein [Actibacterium sp. D379-3]
MRHFMLWDTPRDAAPPVVQNVLARWEDYLPPGTLEILDGADLERHMAQLRLADRPLSIQTKSDLLRLKLLSEHGGVWIDATVLPTCPPGDWLPPLLEPAGFFTPARPGKDRPLSTWLMAAKPGNPLPRMWLDLLIQHWQIDHTLNMPSKRRRLIPSKRRRIHRWWHQNAQADPVWSVDPARGGQYPYHLYFSTHYLFQYLVDTNPEAQGIWQAVPKRSALLPQLVGQTFGTSSRSEFIEFVPHLLDKSPIHKLNWRLDWPEQMFRRPAPETDKAQGTRAT